MQGSARICPRCHAAVDAEALFCPNGCGRLPDALPARDQEPDSPAPASERPDPAPVPQGLRVECAKPDASWYNLSLKQASRATLRFRLSADEGQYAEIAELAVKISGKTVLQERKLPCNCKKLAFWVPDMAGEDSLSVSVACKRHDGGLDEYGTADELQLLVDAVLENGTVNVQLGNNSICNSSDRAGDSSVVIKPEINIENVQFDPNASRYRTDTGRYSPVKMEFVGRTAPPPAAPPPPPSAPCVTLRDGEKVLQLTSLNILCFGKEREKNDYALRVYDASGIYNRRESRAISRRHFRIVCSERGCFLEDLKSTYGTSLDGVAARCRLSWLSPGEPHAVRLCERARSGGVLTLMVRVFSGGVKPAGMTIDRDDGACQRILATWDSSGVPVDDCGNRVAWDDGRFVVRSSDGKTSFLSVGSYVRIGSRTYVVEDFNQPFSHGN